METKHLDLIPGRMHSGPQTMLLMLTNKCVTNCKYCYADRRTKYTPLSTEEVFSLIEQCKELQMSYIDIIGGEVFCRKDWGEILRKLVECDLTPNYISTKMPISEDMAKRLYETGYNHVVQLSLDSLDDTVLAETIGSRKGYVEKMKESVRHLEQFGFKIQIDTILTKQNCNKASIDALHQYIRTISNLTHWEIRIPEMSIYAPETFKDIKAGRKELSQLGEYIKKELKQDSCLTIYFSEEALHDHFQEGTSTDECFCGGSCGILTNRLFVLPDGKISVCEQLYWHPQFLIGDLRRQSLKAIWNSPKAKALYEMNNGLFEGATSCAECGVKEVCREKKRKCPVKIIKAYGQEQWNYPDPRCEFAPQVINDFKY